MFGKGMADYVNDLHLEVSAANGEIARLRAALASLLVEFVAGRKEGHIDSFPATARKVVADARAALNDEQKAHRTEVECAQCGAKATFGSCCRECGRPTDE